MSGNSSSRIRVVSFFRSCLISIISLLFGVQGLINSILVIWLSTVFIQSEMLYLPSIALLLIAASIAAINLFLAFRLRQQNWLLTLGLGLMAWGLLPFLSGLLINHTTIRFRMNGGSMEPALLQGQFGIADRLAYQSNLPKRGDIVLISGPRDPTTFRASRIIGLPGEQIEISLGQVLVDGAALAESNLASQPAYSGRWNVGELEYFVLGDNRNNSADSHIFGSVPFDFIKGKVVWIYWPPVGGGAIRSEEYIP